MMYQVQCLLLCVGCLLVGSFGNLVPFIDKCSWDDKACLKTSSQKAVPYFADGLPDLGIPALDPLNLDSVTLNEGGVNVNFKDTVMTGAKKCQVVDIERNIQDNWLKFSCECPIELTGKYTASGQLLAIPVSGDGPFHIKTDKILLNIKVGLKPVDKPDGQKHWSLGKYEYTFDVKEKAFLHFDNLFNGDAEKAGAVNTLFDQNWKEITELLGHPLVDDVIKHMVGHVQKFANKVPASDLEL